MTSGERAVWAAVYAERRGLGKSVVEAVRLAALEVKNLGSLEVHKSLLDGDADAQEMLDDIISSGADR